MAAAVKDACLPDSSHFVRHLCARLYWQVDYCFGLISDQDSMMVVAVTTKFEGFFIDL